MGDVSFCFCFCFLFLSLNPLAPERLAWYGERVGRGQLRRDKTTKDRWDEIQGLAASRRGKKKRVEVTAEEVKGPTGHQDTPFIIRPKSGGEKSSCKKEGKGKLEQNDTREKPERNESRVCELDGI